MLPHPGTHSQASDSASFCLFLVYWEGLVGTVAYTEEFNWNHCSLVTLH